MAKTAQCHSLTFKNSFILIDTHFKSIGAEITAIVKPQTAGFVLFWQKSKKKKR